MPDDGEPPDLSVHPAASSPPGRWTADPTGRFPQRFWDGVAWTDQVALVDGTPALDPTPAGDHPAPGIAAAPPAPDTTGQAGAGASPSASPSAWASRVRPGWFVLALAGLGVAALSVFTLDWLAGDTVGEGVVEECVGEVIAGTIDSVDGCDFAPTEHLVLTRADLANSLDEAAADPDSVDTFSPFTDAWIQWGAIAGLIAVATALMLALLGIIPWVVPAAAALAGAGLQTVAILEFANALDWEFEPFALGFYAGIGGFLAAAAGARLSPP